MEERGDDAQKRFISDPMRKHRKIQRSDDTPVMRKIFLIDAWIVSQWDS
jgi:hypothetical protein